MKSQAMKIVLAIVIIAMVVGGGIYFLQQGKNNNQKEENNISENQVKPVEIAVADISFDQCNKAEDYSQEAWFKAFKTTATNVYNQISQVCYSKNENLVISMVPGEYCEVGNFYRYNTQNNSLEKANLIDKGRGCLASAEKFGKQDKNIIEVKATGGDAGCRSEMYFDYDFSKNTVELKKEFNICEGEKEGVWHTY